LVPRGRLSGVDTHSALRARPTPEEIRERQALAKDKVRVGFVGAGGIAGSHLGELAKMDDVEVVAICDIVEEKAKNRAADFGGAPFASSAAMYDSAEMDAVFVCIPPSAHGEAEMGAIERGIPFIVEKPVSLSVGLTQEIAAAAAEKGVINAAAYMNRYRKGINRARELFQADPPVLTVGGWIGGSPNPVPGTISYWWVQKHESGGQFVEQVTHTVDLVRYLCGEASHVTALAATGFNKDIENYSIDDSTAVTVRLKNGGVANLFSCCASNTGGGVSLDVYALKTRATFSGWDHSGTIYQADADPEEVTGEPDIFRVQDAAFINAVKTGDPSGIRCTYADGAETLRITLAANKAVETGEVQEL
jgi:myo-inositol 2-dehydrogenase/D-chiro-inositol 1-dehydrogenase